jgi:hypothetical protein
MHLKVVFEFIKILGQFKQKQIWDWFMACNFKF